MRRLLVLAILGLSACMTTPVQRVESLGKGNWQVGIEPGAFTLAGGGTAATLPAFNVSGRYGVTDKFDFGARIGSSAYEILTKAQLTEDDAPTLISIAPHGTFIGFGGGGGGAAYLRATVPVMFGIPVGEHQLVLSPAVQTFFFAGGGGGGSAGGVGLTAGGNVGFNAQLNPGFALHPEVGIQLPVAGAVGATGAGSSSATGGQGAFVTVTVGVLLGKGKSATP